MGGGHLWSAGSELTSHKRRKSPLRDPPKATRAAEGSKSVVQQIKAAIQLPICRSASIKMSAASTSKQGALPFFVTPPPQCRHRQNGRMFSSIAFLALMDGYGAISSASEEGDPCGAWACVKLTVKWQRGPFDYDPITLRPLLPPARRGWHTLPHLFATTESSEVYQDWTVIFSQRQKSPPQRRKWSKEWIFFFFLLLYTVQNQLRCLICWSRISFFFFFY